MYYVVTAKHKSKEENNTIFEYIANVPNIECIYSMAEDAGEEVLSVQEMTIPELIEHEKATLMDTVVRTYVFGKYQACDFETRLQKLKEFNTESEEFFLALQEFNKRQMVLRRLMHRKNKGKIDLDEFLKIMNGLVDCTEEEDIDNLIREMEDKLE